MWPSLISPHFNFKLVWILDNKAVAGFESSPCNIKLVWTLDERDGKGYGG